MGLMKYNDSSALIKKDGITYDQILPAVNGYGRMIKFNAAGKDPSEHRRNVLSYVKDGAFKNGDLNGYGKNIFSNKARVGFFNGQHHIYGKGIYYEKWEVDSM